MPYLMECGKMFGTLEQALEHEQDYSHECVGHVIDEGEGEEVWV